MGSENGSTIVEFYLVANGVRDCSGNPFCEARTKRLERKARPVGERPNHLFFYLNGLVLKWCNKLMMRTLHPSVHLVKRYSKTRAVYALFVAVTATDDHVDFGSGGQFEQSFYPQGIKAFHGAGV